MPKTYTNRYKKQGDPARPGSRTTVEVPCQWPGCHAVRVTNKANAKSTLHCEEHAVLFRRLRDAAAERQKWRDEHNQPRGVIEVFQYGDTSLELRRLLKTGTDREVYDWVVEHGIPARDRWHFYGRARRMHGQVYEDLMRLFLRRPTSFYSAEFMEQELPAPDVAYDEIDWRLDHPDLLVLV